MRLSRFLVERQETILAEWVAFATTLRPAAADMTDLALRDHAPQILEAIAKDLDTPQSREERSDKARGRAPRSTDARETAAQTHALLRARSGFDVHQLIAEYRALRASVIRLWSDDGPLGDEGVEDLIRFGEAVDQAVAESVRHFQLRTERARELLLGMLGHDMRGPLDTILLSAAYLTQHGQGPESGEVANRIRRSAESIRVLLDDLLDFSRTQLGLGVRVAPAETDMAWVVADELKQIRAAHPDRPIEVESPSEARGRWDADRMRQAVRNLVLNAVRHGSPDEPIRLVLACRPKEVRLDVTNGGSTIDPESLPRIFEPLWQGLAEPPDRFPHASLGLGLFIVREIALAHGGEVAIDSKGGKTTLSLRLPLHLPHDAAPDGSGAPG